MYILAEVLISMEKICYTHSAGETYELAKRLGENAKGGEVFCLIGDLGTGKTVFAQGFAAGVGVTEPVNSPTFTIVQVYDEGRLPLYHFDVYRIGDSEEMYEIGYEEYIYGDGVCLIEWADIIKDILPDEYTEIHIDKDMSIDPDYRIITITEHI